MTWKGWEGYEPPATDTKPREQASEPSLPVLDVRPVAPAAAPARADKTTPRLDRGRRRGARRVIVTEDRQIVEHALAKNTGTKGTFFQSIREAKMWVARLNEQDFGAIRNLRRQVKFALQVRRPDGLLETVATYNADFVYERADTKAQTWALVVEDVKPRGGLREDTYILKKKWFEAQYGQRIIETH